MAFNPQVRDSPLGFFHVGSTLGYAVSTLAHLQDAFRLEHESASGRLLSHKAVSWRAGALPEEEEPN
ncbi:predicted protein [Uncinocarpus reesii 1704]|uniref:Uncharacterized protein n=1 Tax=Uncinocarpus reesii (strain UAMH 1704) TaxID=336963 RepID=C4JRF5_UNCRE|nr:uncharacterized protein UREG_05044 [Uncinocarpus reesii 1704]EEP80202.1 predicted protein [Uncinocarpus reesii 1704]